MSGTSTQPAVASAVVSLPPHRYSQTELLAGLRRIWARDHVNLERLERLHEAVQVGSRYLALPIEDYQHLTSFGEANDAFVGVGTELALQACRGALERAGVGPEEVDAIFFTTVTGISTPSLDARIANGLPLKRTVRRVPMFGLGCAGGAAGLARMGDYLAGHPSHTALLVAVELCSLTLQKEDVSVANLIATGLFGDGAAAVVGVGSERAAAMPHAPRMVDQRSAFYPDTEWVMGWQIGESGFRVVLSGMLPSIVQERVAGDVEAFLRDHRFAREHVHHWICHPGGPKIVAALERALELPESALEPTSRALLEVGNLSSASVLLVLSEVLRTARAGERGLVLAMGPGFAAEMILLEW